MARRLIPVKDLSVLILAPRHHDRQLWSSLLKNCDIKHPLSMEDIDQGADTIESGQVDVVFIDEAYGAAGIARILLPSRAVQFAGGRGVCLILCSKRATAKDVINARKLGIASLVILPASVDTVRKHLELASRYVRPSDEELGLKGVEPKQLDTQSKRGPKPANDKAPKLADKPKETTQKTSAQKPKALAHKATIKNQTRNGGKEKAEADKDAAQSHANQPSSSKERHKKQADNISALTSAKGSGAKGTGAKGSGVKPAHKEETSSSHPSSSDTGKPRQKGISRPATNSEDDLVYL